jgi:hypothetical protein
MVNICNPGDTIVVEPSYRLTTTLVLRPESALDTTIKRADGTTPADILIVANDPRFWDDSTHTFVPPTTRQIINKDYPDPGLEVLKVSNRVVWWKDKDLLPKLQPNTFAAPLNFDPLGSHGPGQAPAYYRLVGLFIGQWTTFNGSGVLLTFWPDTLTVAAPGTWGAPHHIVIDRCVFDSDPNNTGWASCQVAVYGWCGRYNAIINCDFHNFYGPGAGDPKMMTWGGVHDGPYHFENNHCPVPNVIFTGGTGFIPETGATFKNFTMRRNHAHRPYWLQPSEDGRPNFVVDIAGDGTSVTIVTPNGWGDPGFTAGDGNPIAQKGGLLVDPATGTCRRFASNGNPFDPTHISLDAAWPGAPVTNLTVHVMYCNWIAASSLTGGAATLNGTTHVTTSQDIPAEVIAENDLTEVDRNQDIRAHYFFVTNSSPGWVSSGFGQFSSMPEHIKIISIDPDRRGMTLASVPSVTGTLPYFVVAWDGVYRPAFPAAAGKAFGEYKMAELCEHEGNIFENNGELWRFHPTSQSDINVYHTATVSGTSITLSGNVDSWWPGLSTLRWPDTSVEWPYVVAYKTDWYTGEGAAGVEFTSTSAGILHDSTLPDGTYQVALRFMAAPQARVADQRWRYNLFKAFSGGPSFFPNTNIWDVRQSARWEWVDNLQMDFGAPHLPSAGTGEVLGHPIAQGPIANRIGQGQRTAYGQPARETLPDVRFSHNTSVRAITIGNASFLTVAHDSGSGAPTADVDRSAGWEINDNIGHGINAMGSIFSLYSPKQAVNGPSYLLAAEVARNVFTAPNASTLVADASFGLNYPDNVGVADLAKLGITNPNAAKDSPLTDYKLRDVFNTGTVTIAGDGLSATLDSGAFSADVVAGQFFRADAASAEKHKITSVTGGNTVHWTDSAHSLAGATTQAYGIGFVGTASDGLNPGVDIDALIDFTAGVDTLIEPDAGGGGGGGGGTGTGGTARPAATRRPAITHRPAVTRRPVLI